MTQMNTAIVGKLSLADIVGRANFGGYGLLKMSENDDSENVSFTLQFKKDTPKGLSFDEIKVDFFEGENISRDDRSFPVSSNGPLLPSSSFDEAFVLLTPLDVIGDRAHEIIQSITRFSREPTYTFQHEEFDDKIIGASIILTDEDKKEDNQNFLDCREQGMKSIVEYAVLAATRVNDDMPFISPVERNAIISSARLPKQAEPSYGR